MEITFVIERQALEMIGRQTDLDEKGLCEIFDRHVNQIHAIAKRLYEDHKTGFYRMTAEHFA